VIRLLAVDDSALVRKVLGQVFASEPDFEVRFARNGVEALGVLAEFAPDVVTLDVHMPQMDGLTCLDRIMVARPCPVVMVSSLTEQGAEATLEALRLGAVDFVPKPAGAVSLHIDEWAPELVARIRSAAGARVNTAHRLTERVRNRLGAAPALRTRPPAKRVSAADGVGLVLVGTSTGGPPALEQVLTQLPAGFPWPILIAQHMPASFTGPLSRRLDAICEINVTEVIGPTVLEAGCAYIGRGNADLIVSRRSTGMVAMLAPAQADYPWHPSTDRLVRAPWTA
jgi:two-component system chemotaxis response regulator CheB